jgi:hypothetical protein
MFGRFRVGVELLARARVRRVTDEEARKLLGASHPGNLAGLFFPYLDPVSGQRVSGRLRRDHPETGADGKSDRKYVCAFGDNRHLYFPPGSGGLLSDPSVPATFVEAEKSALAVASLMQRRGHRAVVIGTGGAWGWRGKTGIEAKSDGHREEARGPLPDLDQIEWAGRKVGIAFDSNVRSNAKVQAAREALARELTMRGALVFLVDVLEELGVNGPDDYIAAHGDDAFVGLIKSARSFNPPSVPGDILNSALHFIRRFVSLSDSQAAAIALWAAHTHAFEAAECTPYLDANSPEKGSGKTRLLEVLWLLVGKPWFTGRVSAAVLVRKINKDKSTLLLDESDAAFSSDKEYAEALRGVLNTGYRKGGAASLCVGQGSGLTFKDFSTFSPKAIAGIGNLPDTVRDRSIPIRMKRAPRGTVARFRKRDVEREAQRIKARLASWCSGNIEALKSARPSIPKELTDRQADCCEPLLAIADLLGGEWPGRARRALIELCGAAQQDDSSIGVMLLSDIRRVFHPLGDEGAPLPPRERVMSEELVEALIKMDDRPWPEWGKSSRPLSQPALARLLSRYDIRPRNIRFDKKILRGYEREFFIEAWGLYLPTDPLVFPPPPLQTATPATSRMNTGENGNFATATEEPCSSHENGVSTSKDAPCSGVAHSIRGNPHKADESRTVFIEDEVTL